MTHSLPPKLFFATIFNALMLSVAASAGEPEDNLVAAIRQKNEALAIQIFIANNIDPATEVPQSTTGEPRPGQTILYLAALYKQWELVRQMLECSRQLNINAGPTLGPQRGTTVLWQTAAAAVEMNLEQYYWFNKENADDLPKIKLWELVGYMLLVDPNYDLSASGAVDDPEGEDGFFGNNVYRLIRACPVLWVQKLLMILEMNRDFDGIDIATRVKNPFWGTKEPYTIIFRDVRKTFKRVALALPEIYNLRTINETSNFDILPPEVLEKIALHALRADDNDLMRIPDNVLLTTLRRFQRVYKAESLANQAEVAIAAEVLNVLAPVDQRGEVSEARMKKFSLIKQWISKELIAATENGILPYSLSAEVRPRLVQLLSTRSVSAISRKWIRDTILSFAIAERAQLAAADGGAIEAEQKRPREEDIVEEARVVRHRPDNDFEEANRAEVTQAVIAAQPGLDWREINAEVEEIMGDVTPMQIDPSIYGDHNNNDEADIAALLRQPSTYARFFIL